MFYGPWRDSSIVRRAAVAALVLIADASCGPSRGDFDRVAQHLPEDGAPLVAALTEYQRAHGRSATSLRDLPPEVLAQIPRRTKPPGWDPGGPEWEWDYRAASGVEDLGSCGAGDHAWALFVRTSGAHESCLILYVPDKNYAKGGWFTERWGEWAYCCNW